MTEKPARLAPAATPEVVVHQVTWTAFPFWKTRALWVQPPGSGLLICLIALLSVFVRVMVKLTMTLDGFGLAVLLTVKLTWPSPPPLDPILVAKTLGSSLGEDW